MSGPKIRVVPSVGWGLVVTLLCAPSSTVAAEPDRKPAEQSGLWTTAPRSSKGAGDSAGPFREQPEPARTWNDVFGNSIEGRFLGLIAATVILEVENQPVACPLVGLNADDRDYVRSWLEARGQRQLFPGATNPEDEAAPLRMPPSRWRTQLKQWGKAVRAKGPGRKPETAEAARNHIRNICDPNALEPLRETLTRDADDAVRTACIEALARIGGCDAAPTLVQLACTDRSGLVRAAAAWALAHAKPVERALPEFAKYLRVDRYRGAALLSLRATGLLQPLSTDDVPDPALTEALIDTIVVSQSVKVPVQYWYDTGWQPRMSPGPGLHRHRSGGVLWVPFKVPVPSALALKMLIDYTGHDYGYDQHAWREWYEHKRPDEDGND